MLLVAPVPSGQLTCHKMEAMPRHYFTLSPIVSEISPGGVGMRKGSLTASAPVSSPVSLPQDQGTTSLFKSGLTLRATSWVAVIF